MNHPRRVALFCAFLLLALVVVLPTAAHAASSQSAFGPIEDILKQINCFMAKALQDAARMLGTILWDVLKLGGMVGLLGADFSNLFNGVIVDALGAVTTGTVHAVIRGSFLLSLALLGLTLLARPFWPDLRIVSFQRAILWGVIIQGFMLNAGGIYTQLETFRTGLAEEIAGAVSSGAIPGCGGDTVPALLCIAGATEAEVHDPSLTALPDSLPPYGGGETIHDLYGRCVYNPAVHYGDAACDPDDPTGDPWEVLTYVQDALGAQVLGLILGFLTLCYGVLMLSLGLSAGMMFVLFPVSAIFAFYQPLEGFPAGVIKNYITIFLKSIVLLTLAAIVIRLFSIAASSLISMAAVAVVALLLCFIMAKEAIATLLGSVSYIGNSVGNVGASLGLSGGGGGGNLGQASPESRMAAMMIGGGPIAQAMMGAPNPYIGGLGSAGLLGVPGALAGAVGSGASAATHAGGARQALSAALHAGGPVGLVAGGAALAMGALSQRVKDQPQPSFLDLKSLVGTRPPEPGTTTTPPARTPAPSPSPLPRGATILPADPDSGAVPGQYAMQAATMQGANTRSLEHWAPDSKSQIMDTTARLQAAPEDVQAPAADLIQASHGLAEQWQSDGQSPITPDGSLEPRFVEETVQQVPEAAGAFVLGQQAVSPERRLKLEDVIAIGAATERIIPAAAAQRGFARAVKTMGQDLDTALRREIGTGVQGVFGGRSAQAEQLAGQMRQAGLANDLGRQLVETVQGDLDRNPRLTAQQFREGNSPARQARVQAWDQATGDAEATDRIVDGLVALGPIDNVTVHEVPRPTAPATPPPAPARPPKPAGPAAPAQSAASAPTQAMPESSEPAATAARPVTGTAPAEPLPVPRAAEPEGERSDWLTELSARAAVVPDTTPTLVVSVEPESVAEPAPVPTAATPAPGEPTEPDAALAQQLRAWRQQTAQDAGQNAFHVLSDATLQEIASRRPQTTDELAAVKGIGPKKLERYGAAILAMTQTTQSAEEKQA